MGDRPTLEETIALLEATLDATHDAILVVDLNRRISRFNRQYLKMFGFTADALERGGLDLVTSRLQEQLEDPESVALWRDLVQEPPAERLDVLRFKDGRVFERYIAPHQIGSRVVGRVASFREIGESVRTAEALEQHRTFLEQAQEVAHIGSWVVELDGSGRLEWSAESHRIFGVPIGAFDGTSAAFFNLVHADDRDGVRATAAEAIAGERPYDIEHRILRNDDATVRWVHERARIARDAHGRPLRMIGTVQDITDRRQLEEQLRQAQKMEAIGRLAGGIAHDLNNALTAIAGYAELARGELPDGHEARADVDEIRSAAERAGSVTRQLLAFSRKQLLEPRVFDLNDTVAAMARLLSRLLGPDIRVHTGAADQALPVLGDPGQVEQALINLAVNARDAMPGGGQLTLSTSREEVNEESARGYVPMPPGEYIVLRVADSGHGMSRETKARIFEPFFTTKDPGKGTGLGLSMVYGTLKQIGGFIFVDTELDRGTTFHLFFPPAGRPAAKPRPPELPRGEGRLSHETLLIVEDEPAVRNLVASALRHEGFELLLAASAEEALSIVDTREGPIDLLLTDANMPGKSGVELAATLTARSPALPVIIMSGYTEETTTIEANGAVELLQKPFTPRELRRRIREALDRGNL